MKKVILNDDVFIIEDFFTQEDCDKLILLSEVKGMEQAKINTGTSAQVTNTDIRNNDRAMFIDFGLTNEIWEKLQPFCENEVGDMNIIGLNEMVRIYRYKEGQKFRKHYDGCYQRNANEFSLFTFMIYLNDGFEGGNTWFKDFEVEPKTGMAIVFIHDILHEGMEIKEGVKYVYRTDVMYRYKENKNIYL
jgi:prolyl 4-hydroxylase